MCGDARVAGTRGEIRTTRGVCGGRRGRVDRDIDDELQVASRGQEFITDIGDKIVPKAWFRAVQTAIRGE